MKIAFLFDAMLYGGIERVGINYLKILKEEDIEIFELSGIAPNPKIESVREGVKLCKELWRWKYQKSRNL